MLSDTVGGKVRTRHRTDARVPLIQSVILQAGMLLCKLYVKRKIFLKHYLAVKDDQFSVNTQFSVAEMVLPVRGPCQERVSKAVVFPWLRSAPLALRRRQRAGGELDSRCQLGKPALGSDRQPGIAPPPALSPIMEEQLANLDPLAAVLQGKAFSGDMCQEQAHCSSPELQCSLLL